MQELVDRKQTGRDIHGQIRKGKEKSEKAKNEGTRKREEGGMGWAASPVVFFIRGESGAAHATLGPLCVLISHPGCCFLAVQPSVRQSIDS